MPLVGRRGELGQFVAVSADPDFRMRLGRYEERAGFPTLANFIPDLVILPAHDPTAAQRCLRAGGRHGIRSRSSYRGSQDARCLHRPSAPRALPRRHFETAALGRLEPTPRAVVRLPGPAGRCVVRSAADRPRSPNRQRERLRRDRWPVTSRVCIRQASNRVCDRTTWANARPLTCPGRLIPGRGVDLSGRDHRPGHGRAAGALGGQSAPDQSPRARGLCTPRARNNRQCQK
jgi:hypothetical protein